MPEEATKAIAEIAQRLSHTADSLEQAVRFGHRRAITEAFKTLRDHINLLLAAGHDRLPKS